MEFSSKAYFSDTLFGDLAFKFEPGPVGFDTLMYNPNESLMELEEKYTTDSKTNEDYESTRMAESPKNNYSKDCLKFCRRISTLVLEQLTLKTELVKEIIEFNSELMKGILENLGFKEIETKTLDNLQIELLMKLWSQFKDIMSYSKNKKICIVKTEHWDLIFDKKISVECLKDICKKLSDSCKDTTIKAILTNQTFHEIFTRMLFCSNNILTLTFVIRDSSPKGESLRSLDTIANFILLALYPQYFSFYNHRSGKFALECCGKCKVCHSKTVPRDFLKLLNQARQQTELFLSQINQHFNFFGAREFASAFMEFTYSQF